jgi:methyl-accepting chemotaxis protein
MAVVAGIKIKPKSQKITSTTIRENAKRDHSPKWDAVENMTIEQYSSHFRDAMKYYNLESSSKDLKPKVIDWMGRNGYDRNTIQLFKKTKDWRCNITMGAIAANLLKGMPEVKAGFNGNKNAADWLRNEIAKVIETGKNDLEEVIAVKTMKIAAPVITIQDRLRETAGEMSEEIDYAIDSWITDPETFDPKAFKIISLLRGKGAKAAHARFIKTFFTNGLTELQELASGNADEQLKEAYKFASRKNVKKLIEFYESIAQACDQIAAEAKVLKKPRAKKAKPAEELVKRVKFKAIDDKLGIVSVPVSGLIGAQAAVIYNTKSRKIGIYIAKTSAGLSVKGTSITEFTEKSLQKTLRKPDVQLKEFKDQNTQKRIETWFSKIKATDTVMNGRMNEEIVLLKIFK